jgi:hypothetical protein
LARLHHQLHLEVLHGIAVILGTLDLVWVANIIAIIGFDELAHLKEMGQDIVKISMSIHQLVG